MIQSTAGTMTLATKLNIPVPKETAIRRKHLTDMLNARKKGRLTIVTAPAGFGKTTLLAQWARSGRQRTAWVSLDGTDNDIVRFWRYVMHAAAGLHSGITTPKWAILEQALTHMSIQSFLEAMINELQAYPEAAALILDDYHLIHDDRIHGSVAFFIEYMPKQLHLVISSRTSVPFPTAKRMAEGSILKIDAEQLKFTEEETEQFSQSSRLPLSSQQIRKIANKTEGWAAGLQLAAIVLRTHANPDRFIDEFGGHHRSVADYLLQEVVSALPERMIDFLTRTSVLQRLNAAICAEVTGDADSHGMLETIKAYNLFLIPLDDRNEWYRYHQLLSQYFQSVLRRSSSAWLEAHLKAGQAYAQLGLLDEAIDHAMEAKQYALAAQWLETHIGAVLLRGELPALLHWFESFPANLELPFQMRLIYVYVLVKSGQFGHAERKLEELEQLCRTLDGDERRRLLSGILFVRSNLTFASGQFEKWLIFIGGLLNEQLPDDPIFYKFNYNQTSALVRQTSLGMKGTLSKDTEAVGKIFTGVLEKHGWHDSLINLYVNQSLLEGYYEWNRLELCRELLRKIDRAPAFRSVPGLFVPHRITEARLYMAEGRSLAAYDILDEAVEAVSALADLSWTHALLACKVRFMLQENRMEEAGKTIQRIGFSGQNRPTLLHEFGCLTYVRYAAKTGQSDAAMRMLELLKPQCEREQMQSSLAEIFVLQALLEYRKGQRISAIRLLHEALSIGERNGYVRTFLDEGTQAAELLSDYLGMRGRKESNPKWDGVSAAYVKQLVMLFPHGMPQAIDKNYMLDEPLSRSELDLLGLLRNGATNKQIAAHLTLSEGTVRVYLSRLYEKLHVSTRTQALIAAQELNIID